MPQITKAQAKRIRELEKSLGSSTFRSLMTVSDTPRKGRGSPRVIDSRRLARWESGRGRLTEEEAKRLEEVSSAAPQAKKLREKNQDKTRWKVNHALRDWLTNQKERGEPSRDAESSRKSAKALGYLGVDTSKKKWYPKRKGKK
jgi:hypothetical protein